jgi:hypothetical protein
MGAREGLFFPLLRVYPNLIRLFSTYFLGFTEKRLHDENMLEIHISSPWDSYSVSVRRFGVIHKYLGDFVKYRVLTQKPNGLFFGFTYKQLFTMKMSQHMYFILWCSYFISVRHFSDVYKVLGVLKNIKFSLKPQGSLAFVFYRKTSARDEK